MCPSILGFGLIVGEVPLTPQVCHLPINARGCGDAKWFEKPYTLGRTKTEPPSIYIGAAYHVMRRVTLHVLLHV